MRLENVRLLCMFDLPVETKQDQKAYRIFRKHLIENGFIMMQYSIYYRTLPNRSKLQKYEALIKQKAPKHGNVRLLYVTEKQFQDMKILVGEQTKQEIIIGSKRMVVI